MKYKGGKMRYLTAIVFLIILMPLCLGAVETLGTFKKNECIVLPQSCASCTYNNITSIQDSAGELAISSETAMTKSGSKFNKTFCNNTVLGHYIVNGHGDLNGVDTVWSYDYYITSTGQDDGTTIPLFFLLGAIILFVIAFITKNWLWGFFSGLVFTVGGVYMMIYGFGNLNDLYSRAIAGVALGVGLILFIVSAFDFLGAESEAGGFEGSSGGDIDED